MRGLCDAPCVTLRGWTVWSSMPSLCFPQCPPEHPGFSQLRQCWSKPMWHPHLAWSETGSLSQGPLSPGMWNKDCCLMWWQFGRQALPMSHPQHANRLWIITVFTKYLGQHYLQSIDVWDCLQGCKSRICLEHQTGTISLEFQSLGKLKTNFPANALYIHIYFCRDFFSSYSMAHR